MAGRRAQLTLDTVQVERKLQQLIQRFPMIVSAALYTSSLNVLVPAMREHIKMNKNVFEGTLIQGLGARAVTTPKKNAVSVEVGALKIKHGLAIEQGQKPGRWPDMEKMHRWARKKLGLEGAAAQSAAFFISKSIFKKGSKAYPFVMPSFESNKGRLVRDFAARIRATQI